jgi:hypothetical protein
LERISNHRSRIGNDDPAADVGNFLLAFWASLQWSDMDDIGSC